MISPRECIRIAYKIAGGREVPAGRDSGIGMWVQEVAWRDFYQHVSVPPSVVLRTWTRVYRMTADWVICRRAPIATAARSSLLGLASA
jgi:deoxyribodipyrimidine photo-lyase